MLKRITFFLSLLLIHFASQAQVFDIRAVQSLTTDNDSLIIDFEIRTQSGTAGLGSSNFIFDYNTISLDTAGFAFVGNNAIFGSPTTLYNDVSIGFQPSFGYFSVNVTQTDFAVVNDPDNVNTSYVNIGRLYLPIVNNCDSISELTWRSSPPTGAIRNWTMPNPFNKEIVAAPFPLADAISGSISVIALNDTICEDESVQLNFNIAGNGPFNISFTAGSQDFSFSGINLTDSRTVTLENAGAITVAFDSITDAKGCVETNTLNFTDTDVLVDDSVTVANIITVSDSICISDLPYTLDGNNPGLSNGLWTQTAGSGTITFADNTVGNTNVTTATDSGLYQLQWEITSPLDGNVSSGSFCPSSLDTFALRIDSLPSASNVGADIDTCHDFDNIPSLVISLTGNAPTIGTGLWTQVSGPAAGIADNTDPNSNVTITSADSTYRFVWTISNGQCQAEDDTLKIVVDGLQTTPLVATADVSQCEDTITLLANTISTGIGTWSTTSSSNIAPTNTPSTSVSNLPGDSVSTFYWNAISEFGVCPDLYDSVNVTRFPQPDFAEVITGSIAPGCGATENYVITNINPTSSYSWTLPGGFNITAVNSVPANDSVDVDITLDDPSFSGDIIIQETTIDGCVDFVDTLAVVPAGCTFTASFNVLPNDTVCVGDVVTLASNSAIPDPDNSFFTWDSTGIGNNVFITSILAADTVPVTFTSAGTKAVRLSVTDPGPVLTDDTIINIVVLGPPDANFVLNSSSSICSGDTVEFQVNITGGAPPYTLQIDTLGGGGSIIITNYTSGSPIKIVPTLGQMYMLSSVSDNFSCSGGSISGGPHAITVNPIPTASFGAFSSSPVCQDEPLTVDINGNTGDTVYLSQGGVSLLDTVLGAITPITIPLSTATTGTINYTIDSVISAAGCISNTSPVDAATITVNPRIDSAQIISLNGSFCAGGTDTLRITVFGGSGLYDLNISGNLIQGVSSPFDTVVAIGATYTLNSVTDDSACSISPARDAIVTEIALPTLTSIVAATNTLCEGENTSLTFTLGSATSDSFNVIYSSNILGIRPATGLRDSPILVSTPNLTTTQTFTVDTVYDENGCFIAPSSGNTTTITVNDAPNSATLTGGDTICSGGTDTLFLAIVGGTGPYTFELVDTTGVVGGTTTITNYISGDPLIVTPTASTFYSLGSPATDANGCNIPLNSLNLDTVIVNPLPDATISGTTAICLGDSTALTFNFPVGTPPFDVTYQDDLGNGFTAMGLVDGDSIFVSPSGDSTYTIASVTDANGCTNSAVTASSAVITVNPLPVASITGDNNICPGDSTPLTFTVSAGLTPYQVFYSNDIGDNGSVSGPSPLSDNVSPALTAIYQIDSVIDNLGCTSIAPSANISGTATITLNPTITAATIVGGDTICVGGTDSLAVDITGGTGPFTLFIDGNPSITNYSSSDSIGFSPIVNTIWILDSVSDALGCSFASSSTDTTTVNPLPTGTITGTSTICEGDTATLTFNLTGTGPFDVYYTDGTASALLSSIANGDTLAQSPLVNTTYNLLSILDLGTGCSDTLPTLDTTGSATITINQIDETIFVDPIPTEFCFGTDSAAIWVNLGPSSADSAQIYDASNGLQIGLLTPGVGTDTFYVDTTQSVYAIVYNTLNSKVCSEITDTIDVTAFENPTVSFANDSLIVCLNDIDTIFDMSIDTVFGGTGTYGYLWTPNTSLDDASKLDAAYTAAVAGDINFILTATDGNGCFGVDSIRVITYPEVQVDLGIDTITVCYGDTDSLGKALAVIGGFPGTTYEYQWNTDTLFTVAGLDTVPNPEITGLVSGIYSYVLTVTDSVTGCIGVDSIYVLVNDSISFNLSTDTTFLCFDDPSAVIGTVPTAQGGTGTLSHAWTPATNLDDATLANPTFNNPGVAGFYYYTDTVTDALGCQAGSDTVVIRVLDSLAAIAGADTTICELDATTLGGIPAAQGGFNNPANYTYLWSGDDVTLLNDVNASNPVLTLTSAVTADSLVYSLVVTDTSRGLNCVANDTVVVYINQIDETIFVDPIPTEFCFGTDSAAIWVNLGPSSADSAQIYDASNGLQIGLLTPGVGTDTFYVDTTQSVYAIVYNTLNSKVCSEITDTIDVTAFENPTVSFANDSLIVCLNDIDTIFDMSIDTVFGGTGTYGYLWTPNTSLDDASKLDAAYTAAVAGDINFILTATDGNGCFGVDSIRVITYPEVQVDLGIDTITVCYGDTDSLGKALAVIGGFPGTTYEYQWNTDTLFTVAGLDTVPNPEITGLVSGIYSYVLTVTDSVTGCIGVDSIYVLVNDSISFNLSTDTTFLCFDDPSAVIGTVPTAQGGTGTLSHAWTPATNLDDATLANPTFNNPGVAGFYYYTDTVTDALGCQAGSDTVVIRVLDSLAAIAGADTTICELDATTLGGIPAAQGGFNNPANYTYLWSGDDVTLLNDVNASNPVLTLTSAVTADSLVYSLVVTDTSRGLNCVANDTVVVYINQIDETIFVDPIPTEFCFGTDSAAIWVNLGPSSADSAQIYDASNGLQIGLLTPGVGTDTFYVDTTQSVYAIVYNTLNSKVCSEITDTIDVTAFENPTVSFANDSLIVCLNDIDTIFDMSIDTVFGGTGTYGYLWTPNTSLDDASKLDAAYTAAVAGDINFILTATDGNGCFGVDSIRVITYPEVQVDLGIDTITVCYGDTDSLGKALAVIGGFPGTTYEYQWNTDTLFTVAGLDTVPNPEITGLVSGIYSYVLTVTDSVTGCIGVDSIYVLVNDSISFNLSTDTTFLCFDDPSAVIGTVPTAQGGTGTLSHAWTPATNLDDATLANPTFNNPGVAGFYYYTDTVTDALGCQAGSDTVVIRVLDSLAAIAGADTTICELDATTLGGIPAAQGGFNNPANYTYLWSGDDVTLLNDVNASNPVLTLTSAVTADSLVYSLVVTDTSRGLNCVANDTVVVYINQIDETIFVDPIPTEFCFGTDSAAIWVNLGPSSADSAQIYDASNGLQIGLLTPGVGTDTFYVDTTQSVYAIVYNTLNSKVCSEITDTIDVTAFENPTVSFANDSLIVCLNDIDTIFDMSIDTVFGGTGTYGYLWTPNTSLDDASKLDAAYTAAVAGDINFILTATDGNGCFGVDSIRVITYPEVQVDLGIDTITVCYGDTDSLGKALAVIGGFPGTTYEYQWNTDTLFTVAGLDTVPNPEITGLVSGIYSYVLTVTDSVTGCIGVDSIYVLVNDSISFNLSTDTTFLCFDDPSAVIGTVPTAQGGTGTLSHAWTPATNLDDATLANPTFNNPGVAGFYYYTDTVTDALGCQAGSDTVVIRVLDSLAAIAGADTTICELDATTLGGIPAAQGGFNNPANYTYLWSGDDVTLLNDVNASNPVLTLTSAVTADSLVYSLVVTDTSRGLNCVANDTVVVYINQIDETIFVDPIPTEFCFGTDSAAIWVNLGPSSADSAQIYDASNGLQIGLLTPGVGTDTFYVDTTQSVYAIVYNTLNSKVCSEITDTIDVTAFENPTVSFANDSLIVCLNDIDTIFDMSIDTVFGGTGTYGYLWTPNTSLDDASKLDAAYTAAVAGDINFILTATDGNGCFGVDSIRVITYPEVQVDLGIDTITVCYGDTDSLGKALAVIGGFPGTTYEYQWNTDTLFTVAGLDTVPNPEITGLVSGIYSYVLTVTDSVTGCIGVDSIYVLVNDSISFNLSTDTTFLCFDDPSAVIGTVPTAQGGTGTLSHAWTPATNLDDATLANPTFNNPGVAGFYYYTDTVTDALGCQAGSDTVVIRVLDSLAAIAGADTTICELDATTLGGIPAAQGGFNNPANYTYLWSGDDVTLLNDVNASNPVLTLTSAVTADSLVYSLVVTDTSRGLNCVANDTVVVYINQIDETIFVDPIPTEFCFGTDSAAIWVNLGPSSADSAQIYDASNGLQIGLLTPGVGTDTFYVDTTQSVYAIVYNTLNSKVCSEITDTIDVTAFENPTVSFANDSLIVCFNETVQLFNGLIGDSISGGLPNYTFQWSPADSVINPTDTATTYTANSANNFYFVLTATDQNGCIGVDSIEIITYPEIILDLGNDTLICFEDSLNLTSTITGGRSTAVYSYQWDNTNLFDVKDDTLSTPLVIGDTASVYTYILTVTDTTTGCTDTDTIVVTVNPEIVVNYDSDTICFADAGVLINGNATGGTGTLTYNWTPPTNLNDPALANPVFINPDTAGVYTYNLSVTDGSNCVSEEDTVNITVSPQINVFAGNDTTLCFGDTSLILGEVQSAIGGYGSFEYLWTSLTPGVNASSVLDDVTLANPRFIYNSLLPASVTLVLNVNDTTPLPSTNICSFRDTVVIGLNPEIRADAGTADFVCFDLSQLLNASVSGGSNSFTYLWDGASGQLNDSTLLNPTLTGTASGVYNLVLTASDAAAGLEQCFDTAQIAFTVNDTLFANAGSDTLLCFREPVTLGDFVVNTSDYAGSGGSGGLNFSWTPAGNLNNSSISNPLFNPSGIVAGGVYPIILSVTDLRSCIVSDTIVVTMNDEIVSSITPSVPLCLNDSTLLSLNISGGATPFKYSWTSVNGNIYSNDTLVNPYIISDSIGTDTLEVFIIDSNNCQDSASQLLDVLALPSIAFSTADSFDICFGQDTLIVATGTANNNALDPIGYSWNNSATSNSINVEPPVDSLFIVTVTNLNTLCNSIDTVNVIVNELPDIQILGNGASSDTFTICVGQSITFTGTNAGSNGIDNILWYADPTINIIGNTSSPIILSNDDLSQSGNTLFLEMVDLELCVDTASVFIRSTEIPDVNFNLVPEEICAGDTIDLVVTGGPTNTIPATFYRFERISPNPILLQQSLDTIVRDYVPVLPNSISVPTDYIYSVRILLASCNTQLRDTLRINPLPVLQSNPAVDTVCFGQDIELSVSNTIAQPLDSMIWSFNTTLNNDTIILSNVTQDSLISVIAYDTNGCFSSTSFDVQSKSLPSVALDTISDISICAGNTFDISLLQTNNLTYMWKDSLKNGAIITNPNGNSPTLTVDTSGLYYAVVTTAGLACIDSSIGVNVIRNELPIITLDTIPDTAEFCFGESVTILETSGYVNYSWIEATLGNVGNTDSLVVDTSGSFYVIVEDINGCIDSNSTNPIVFIENPLSTDTIGSGLDSVCAYSTETYTASSFNGVWTLDASLGSMIPGTNVAGVFTSPANTASVDITWNGAANGYLFYQSADDCGVLDSLLITVTPNPQAAITAQLSACSEDTLNYAALNPLAGDTYQWSTSNTTNFAFVGSNTADNVNLDFLTLPLNTGSVTTTLSLIQTNSFGCDTTASITITSWEKPDATFNGDTTVCDSNTYTYTIATPITGATYTYSVSPAAAASITQVGNGIVDIFWNLQGSATITAIGVNGDCQDTVVQQVSIQSTPSNNLTALIGGVPQASLPTSLCVSTDTIRYRSNAALVAGTDSINWVLTTSPATGVANLVGALDTNFVDIAITAPGTYILTYQQISSNGCQLEIQETVVVNDTPSYSFALPDTIVCIGDQENYQLNGTFTNLTFAGSAGQNVSYDATNRIFTANWNTADPNAYIAFEIFNGDCSINDSLFVQVDALPNTFITPGDTTYCANKVTKLFANPANDSTYTYQWFRDGNLLANRLDSFIVADTSGIYEVVITTVGGCVDTSSNAVTATLLGTPDAQVEGDSTICAGDSVLLTLANTASSYEWYSSSDSINFSLVSTSDQITVNNPGYYYAVLFNSGSGNGCTDTSEYFYVRPLVDAVASFDLTTAPGNDSLNTFCANDTIYLTGLFAGSELSFEWTSTGQGNLVSPFDTSTIYLPSEFDQEVIFEFNVINNCLTNTAIDTAIIRPAPDASYVPSALIAELNQPITFTLNQQNAILYDWRFGAGGSSNDVNPIFSYGANGDYLTYLIATNEFNCEDSFALPIHVTRNQLIYVPNVFAPTASDPENKVMKVYSTNIAPTDFQMQVFNRWGALVYETGDLAQAKGIGWNGQLKSGADAPNGVYTYYIKGAFLDGETFQKVGTVNLIR